VSAALINAFGAMGNHASVVCCLLMKTDVRASASVWAVALTAASLWAVEPARPGMLAPDFQLNDQYDKPVRLADYRGKPALLIYGDRLGSRYMAIWAKAVLDAFPSEQQRLALLRIANLKVVPPFFYGFAKRKFQAPDENGNPRVPVLLDWDGLVAKQFGAVEDVGNVYLIDSTGVLLYSAAGKATSGETRALIEAIRTLDSERPPDANIRRMRGRNQ
jgi:peroxiredoxin